MIRTGTQIGLVALAALLLVFALQPGPAVAEETCRTIYDIEAEVEASGGAIAGAAYYRGTVTDSMLVVEGPEMVMIYGFKDGCAVAFVALEEVEKGQPA